MSGIIWVYDADGKKVPLTATIESFKANFEPLGYRLVEEPAKGSADVGDNREIE